MKDVGLLMKPEMVNATLEDRKNQTRRPITFHNSTTGGLVKRKDWHELIWKDAWFDTSGGQMCWHVLFRGEVVLVYPRVQPRDVLWVRETWQPCGPWDCLDGMHIRLKSDNSLFKPLSPPRPFLLENDGRDGLGKDGKQKWRPSILMPRWACRLELDVLKVRSERVREISGEDALREGIKKVGQDRGRTLYPIYGTLYDKHGQITIDPKYSFQCLWDSINAERGFSWEDNHPVWIYDFKVRP